MLSSDGNPCIEGIKLVHPALQCARDDLLRGTKKFVIMMKRLGYCVELT